VDSGISLIALNRVIAARADDFEGWLHTVVLPAVAKKPELAQRWEVLRSTDAADGVVNFVFLFQGGPPGGLGPRTDVERSPGCRRRKPRHVAVC
jgi:hypothetical protein